MGRNEEEQFFSHVGMPRRSGRYPWGSGKQSYQHTGDFLSRIETLKKSGMSETDISKDLGLTTTQFRTQKSLANAERRSTEIATAKGLREKGYSYNEIANKLNYPNESSVRSLLNKSSEERMNQAQFTAKFLKEQVDKKGMIDVGAGVERELNISKEKMNQALYILEREGYPTYGGGLAQVTNAGKQTNLKVLCPPGTEHKEIYQTDKLNSLNDYVSHDGGDTFDKFVYPKSMDSKRVGIRYAEEGGLQKDGLVEIRRNVDDLSLGNSHYAQVRILVDNAKYIKGMAVYSDDLPAGVDIVFNTNKKKGTPKGDVLKNIKEDPDNPFGSLIKAGGQSYYDTPTKKHQLSLINKRAEEGDWNEWSDHLSSQFLAKQSITLIKKQLGLAMADKKAEYDDICALDNPTIKKSLLKSFSDDCDSAAVHLKAAALPRQKYQVLLPITSLKEDECYAPNFADGEKLALVRYPHGGTFEIPIVTVNNKNRQGIKMLGKNPKDAIGINSKVAEQLSGADFDGDTALAIPTGTKTRIIATKPLSQLKDFDPKDLYGHDKVLKDSNGDVHYFKNGTEFKAMKTTQLEMGKASNLITDMTLKGAVPEELARAVKHSMVVIDAEKHGLDYKKSFDDNQIGALKKKYQGSIDETGHYSEGASTLLSKSKSEASTVKTRGQAWINPDTGAYEHTRVNPKTGKLETQVVDETYTVYKTNKRTGEIIETTKVRTSKTTKMANTTDARTLSSGTPQEEAYAEYANTMKSLANQARKTMVHTGKIPYSKNAKEAYAFEVAKLDADLNVALKNAPRERRAQVLANTVIDAKTKANPDMSKAEVKKLKQQELNKARVSVGAKREPIKITDREWEAIQAGAISEHQLTKIINNVDIDSLRQRATPRKTTALRPSQVNRIKALQDSGYTNEEIAKALGVGTSTVHKYLN